MHEQSVPHFTGDAEPMSLTISLSQPVGVAGPPPPSIHDLLVKYVRLFCRRVQVGKPNHRYSSTSDTCRFILASPILSSCGFEDIRPLEKDD